MSNSQLTGDYGYINLTTSTYANPVTVTSTGTVAGVAKDGLYASTAWTIQNYGTITSTDMTGINLSDGGKVYNAGYIGGGNDGVYLGDGGAVSNAAGGTITGGSDGGIIILGAGSVVNHGSIYGHFSGVGVYEANGIVTNAAGGTVTGGYYGVAVAGGSVANAAGGLIDGATGVAVKTDAGTVTNEGSIAGGFHGIYMYGGLVTNEAGGTITSNGSPENGSAAIAIAHTYGTVFNAGYIGGGQDGVALSAGVIGEPFSNSGTVDNTGTIHGSSTGVFLFTGGLVSNGAGGMITGASDAGVDSLFNHGSVYNAGSIAGSTYGVFIYQGGALGNAAGGTIFGEDAGVKIGGASATMENAGYVGGGDAVILDAYISNRLIIDEGAVFHGVVSASNSGALNTIELASSASAGTLMGLGGEYLGFGAVTIDAAASWDVEGLKSAFADTTISGFGATDSLDLTNLTYASGATAVLTGDTLAVTSDGATIDITMTDTTGTLFYAHDVGGDVLVNESPACYLRGTLILTDRGKVPVEDLRVGDGLVTVSGEAMSLKWIGRRSYAGWAAAGNSEVQPILFKAGSLADHVPSRDLLVSPEHAMYLEGALIPARHLVNGISIVKAGAMHQIHYFHLELERHAVIFAEDAASETYIDDDNRGMFHNVYEYYAEHPEATRGLHAEYCAPRVEDGFALEAARRRLAGRATRLRPDGTAAPVRALGGQLDLVSRTLIEGWAFAPDTPDEAVALVILDNGAVIGEVTAGRYRADLEACGIGDGRHAFSLALPRGLAPEFRHLIEVRREPDWTLLPGSGISLAPDDAALAA